MSQSPDDAETMRRLEEAGFLAEDIYDDPELEIEDESDFPELVVWKSVGDHINMEVTGIERVTTRNGAALRYSLFDHAKDKERTMFAGPSGAKDLWRQLQSIRPRIGDTLNISLIENRPVGNGTFKRFNVEVSRQQTMNTGGA